MSSEPITDSPDPRLQAALAEYLERIDRGEAVDREAFLAEFPDLTRELAPLLETADALEEIGGNSGESRPPDLSTHSHLSHDIETVAPGRQGQEATTSGPLPVEFGRYRTIKPLGQGAMGVVYLAEDTQLHRKVALKTSSFDNDHSGELLERFYREARSAATLRHPNICPVYDVGEIQGRHYISMAYIEGRTLATYVNASGSLHERQVLVLVRKLALALQDAHQHEIVHRDLKPANIMVDLKGEPIIMDFGLARVGYSEEESRLTQVGMIVGSPAYMSPEQVGGHPEQLTGAADQYSLGVILFELLIGHPPFRGSVTAVVGQILTQPPPRLSSLRSDVSPAVEALCLKMLAKSPSERFASMKHVADEIAVLLRGSSAEKGAAAPEKQGSPATSIPKTSLHEALVEEARQRLKQRDYPKAIEMLQQIPEADRPPEAAKLLAQALKLMDEVNFVLQEMEAALQSRDGATLAKRAQELVKLKPDHPRARQVRELIKKHGPERALQFLAENSGTTPPVDRGSQRRIGLIAGGFLAAMLLGIVIWFGSGKTRLKVTVNDPTIEVAFRGSQLSIRDGASQVDVEPGDQELTIRVAGVEFQTPKFSLKKGTTSVVEVERAEDMLAVNLAGAELAAWPLEKAATPPPATATQLDTPTADPNGAIDLLAAVDVSQLGDSDMKWERKGQTVVCTGTGAAGKSAWKGFRLPTEIGGDYEVELEFQQRAFWPMQIDFPLQDTAVRISLTGDSCDLMIEDDKSQPNAEKTWRSTATKLKTMVPQKLVVRVRQPGTRAEIEATLDGVTLGTYSGERSRLVLPSWVKPNVKQITSGSLCGNLAEGYIELRKAVYRPLSRVSPELVGVSPSAVSSPPKAPPQAGTTVSFPQDGRFTAARSLTEVNQDAPTNAHPRIAPDGLSLYWTREAAGVGSTIMQATRPTTDAPFSAIKPVLQNARLASVSSDGLEIACAFDANGDGKPNEFCTSRRATTSDEFPKPQVIPSMTGLHHALGSTFADHGNTLIVLAAPQPNTTRVYFRASRSGPDAAWGTPQRVTIPNTPPEMDRLTIPSLTSGGKHLIFAYQDPTNRPVEWGCMADATSDPFVFANPRHLLLDGERFVVRGGTYCPATGELFYTHTGTIPPFDQSEIRVARAENVPVTPQSNPDDGWVDLFNGRDLTGWEVVNNKGIYPNSTDAGWAVVDGAIECRTTDHGWLRTADEFEDFDLELKFRFAGQGSSSLILRTRGSVAPLADGLWVDLNHSAAGGVALAKIDSQPRLLPAGEWNQMRIEARGTKYRVEVNGHDTAVTDLSAHHWAASLKQAGRIGLNNYKGQAKGVAFRDIRIRKQPQAPATFPAEADNGWTDLFNGRDLTGWTALGVQGWRVKDGVLIGETQEQQGWLMSNTEYDNFEFDFEYRLAPGTNGGVFLRAWADGPISGKEFLEVQLLDETDEIHRTMPPSQRTGAIFGILEARPLPDLRPNLWHRMNIAIHEQEIRVSVDGQEVTRGKLPVGKQPHGHLGLQLSPRTKPQKCEFQKLRIRPLKDGLPVAQAAEKMPQDNAVVKPNDDKAPAQADRGPQEVRHGLKAEIFEGRNFDKKVAEQIEPNVECFWELGAPAKEAPVDNFSVRFSGWLRAPKPGRYKLILHCAEGCRLKINHNPVVDNWRKPGPGEVSLDFTDVAQPVEVEAFDADGPAWISLLWQQPGASTPCPIPFEAFFLDEASSRQKLGTRKTGLLAEYFDKSFTKKLGEGRAYRTESNWYLGSPMWGLPTESAARYTGVLVPPETGSYKLIAWADNLVRIWIDDKPVLETTLAQPYRPALINLEAGKPYDIRIEFVNSIGPAAYHLHWVLPNTTKEVSIPPECLFANKSAAQEGKGRVMIPEVPEEKGPVVPAGPEPQEVRHGLKAEIFEGRNFDKKVAEQIEPNVECFWELGAPAKEAPVDNFSVRFSGWLRAPKTGRYKLFLSSKDGSRLKINNQTVIDNWKLKPDVVEVSAELTQDPQPIEVEVFNADLYSWVSLLWQPAGTATVCHIPATALYPDVENARSKASRTSIDKTGLVAEYFDKSFGRRLATDRVYRIEEIWGHHSPRWGLPTDSAAKYTGILVPPVSGQYKLIAGARQHIRVWIDDKPTLESKGIAPQNAIVELEANKPHEIRVEVLTTGHGAHYLHWIPPGTTKEVSIPPECLFPNKAAVRQVTNVPPIKAPTEEKPAPSTINAAERETIERGLAKLKADDEAAGKKLLKAFDEQIEKARTAPKIPADERVVRIKSLEDEKALFEKHGHIPFSLAMRTETLKYLREFTEARTDTAKVYDKLIESLTRRKSDEAASLMRTERDIAAGPKVIGIWKTTSLVQKDGVWTSFIWSDGSLGGPKEKSNWIMDQNQFAINWFRPPNTRWTDNYVIRPDGMTADVYDKGNRTCTAERVAP